MHHGELLAGIDERLGTPEMNTVLTLTQEEHDDKERREPEKQQDEQPETSKKKGKKGNEDKKSKYYVCVLFGDGVGFMQKGYNVSYILKIYFYYQRILMRKSLVHLSTKR